MSKIIPLKTASPTLSVVIPVYNSEGSLWVLMERLTRVLASVSAAHEVILVNDGSHDSSWKIIQDLAAAYPSLIGIDLGKNYGQHNALLAGVRAAKNEIIVTLDDDLQNPPEEIPTLLNVLKPEVDVVYGAREKEQHGFSRNLASRLVKLSLTYFLGAKTANKSSAFRAFRSHLREGFKDYQCDFISIDVLLSWMTNRFAYVPVAHEARYAGKSNYSPWKLYRHALNMLTGFTTLPLQLATAIGLVFTIFGLVILGYVLINYLGHGDRVPGFAFLASIISIFSGATLFSIGVLGEYLARMYSRTIQRPAYSIRSQVGFKARDEKTLQTSRQFQGEGRLGVENE
ncbi:glycosyltransferase [bacterium]|nr:glycosyltransferase [bacterium]NBX83820.1 glycosyltransferase [bacterium]